MTRKTYSNSTSDEEKVAEEEEDYSYRLERIERSRRDDPESYYNELRALYNNIREEAKAMYFFCFMRESSGAIFTKRFEKFRLQPYAKDTSSISAFGKWKFGHKDILDRTFGYVKGTLDREHFAYFVFLHSSPCNCYEIETGGLAVSGA